MIGLMTLAMMLTSQSAQQREEPAPPNILLILADDLAWNDPACCGHTWHRTPHIDRLAESGMRFTAAYAAAPICSASRASLLTGRTVARLQFEFVTKHESGHQQMDVEPPLLTPPFTLNLPLEEVTIAEALSERGYDTAFCGKWHLNQHYERRYLAWHPKFGPGRQGFQTAVEDFGDHPYGWGKRTPEPLPNGKFPRDSMIDRAVDFVRTPRASPYFLMVSTFHVHTPVRNRCRWLVDEYDRRVPESIQNRRRRVEYAAFVETLDHHVGRLLQAVADSGAAENTLVIMTSDNGGHPEYCSHSPFRGSKWNLYEGGIRVPMIVRWPERIQEGVSCDVPVIGYDLLPTCVAASGAAPVASDGIDLSPLFAGESELPQRPLIWHFPYYHPERNYSQVQSTVGVDDFAVSQTRPQSAMRFGRHKLVQFYENDSIEMYDLERDPAEQHDLSQLQTRRAEVLRRELNQRLTEMNARIPSAR